MRTVVGGDGAQLSIAAASIVAKVTRDRIMRALAPRYPGYGWETNVGYATADAPRRDPARSASRGTTGSRSRRCQLRLDCSGPP